MIRAVLLFLVIIAILAMIGKWRLPNLPRRRSGTAIQAARKCPTCGAYNVGDPATPCERPDCPSR